MYTKLLLRTVITFLIMLFINSTVAFANSNYEHIIEVTPENLSSINFNETQNNTLYKFGNSSDEAYEYTDPITILVPTNLNIIFDGANAIFDGQVKFTLGKGLSSSKELESNIRSGDYVIKNFMIENSLSIVSCQGNVAVMDCNVKALDLEISNSDVEIKNNVIKNDDEYNRYHGQSNSCGIYVIADKYELDIIENEISSEKGATIVIQGDYSIQTQVQENSIVNSLNIKGNVLQTNNSNIVKIYNDVTYAPVEWPEKYRVTDEAIRLTKQLFGLDENLQPVPSGEINYFSGTCRALETSSSSAVVIDILCRTSSGSGDINATEKNFDVLKAISEKSGFPQHRAYEPASCDKAAGCKVCGYTDGKPLGHEWVYENIECGWNGYCNTAECNISGEIYLTQPENLSYDSNLKECTVINELENEYNPPILSEVSYYASDDLENALTSAPSQIGTYVAKLNLINTDNSIISVASLTFEIVLPNITGISIKNYSATYDGNLHGIDVSIPDGANIVYSTDNINWIEECPTYKEVGVYTVYYKVTKDNHNDYLGSATVTIKKKTTTSSVTRYEIEVIESVGGTIIPGTYRVKKGSDKTFEIEAEEGYEIEDVLVDGESVGAVSTYKFENVKTKHTIEAKFKMIEEEQVWENPFKDVNEDDWFYEAVKYTNENKLINGMANDEFGGNVSITRGMIVTILYRYAGAETLEESTFDDVAEGSYYSNAIAWAAKNGIVNGMGDNKFAPDAEITREQLATILYRFAVKNGMDVSVGENTNILSYDDFNEIYEYAIPAFQWACGSGVITGRTMSTLVPKGTATRAEVATMLMRFCENI